MKTRPRYSLYVSRYVKNAFILVTCIVWVVVLYSNLYHNSQSFTSNQMLDWKNFSCVHKHDYDPRRNMPIIFIGGMPRSGTTLMRVLLDAHPKVKCGPETHILPKTLMTRMEMRKPFEKLRLELSGITDEVLDNAYATFFVELFLKHSHSSSIMCKKDPFVLLESVYLKKIFPNAKFILMIRDGRAVAHSINSRNIHISGINPKNYTTCLNKWNAIMTKMIKECHLVHDSCFKLYYEKLILNPEYWLRQLFNFLNIEWNKSVLSHDKLIKNGSIKVSLMERSTDQVFQPISSKALYSWVGKIPQSVKDNVDSIAPLLRTLGYDTSSDIPNYGKLEQFVLNNDKFLEEHKSEFQNNSLIMNELRFEILNKLKNIKHEDENIVNFLKDN